MLDSGDGNELVDQVCIQRTAGDADIDVGLQRIVQPVADRRTETRDHDCHADGRRNRDRQRNDRYPGPAQGPSYAVDGKPAGNSGYMTGDGAEQCR